MTAIISPCGRYRYTLERPIALAPKRWLLWVMLNPSTAPADVDDATIRRVIGFTRSWGYDGALVGNLYAFRATKPADLWAHMRDGGDVVGPQNEEHLNQLALRANAVVLAWGAHAEMAPERAEYVRRLLNRRLETYALGFTASGQPRASAAAAGELAACEVRAVNALRCPIHNLPARHRASSAHMYGGRDFGPIWECPDPRCDAICGCHPDGSPLGTLATKALRQLRIKAHAQFDKLWCPWEAQQLAYPEEKRVIRKLRRVMRLRAYEWLAAMMGKPFDDTHIAMFDEADVQRALAILAEHKPTSASIRDWAKARREAA